MSDDTIAIANQRSAEALKKLGADAIDVTAATVGGRTVMTVHNAAGLIALNDAGFIAMMRNPNHGNEIVEPVTSLEPGTVAFQVAAIRAYIILSQAEHPLGVLIDRMLAEAINTGVIKRIEGEMFEGEDEDLDATPATMN